VLEVVNSNNVFCFPYLPKPDSGVLPQVSNSLLISYVDYTNTHLATFVHFLRTDSTLSTVTQTTCYGRVFMGIIAHAGNTKASF
jgi:hypothetical protein